MGIESEKDTDEIEVKLNLTTFKPLNAAWITEFYDLMTYNQGKSGITGVIESRLVNLSSVDPFAEIDPLVTKPTISNNKPLIPEEEIVERGYPRDWYDDAVEEWEMEGQDETRSAFDIFYGVKDDGE